MARTSMLGKRKAGDGSEEPVATRKKRVLRSSKSNSNTAPQIHEDQSNHDHESESASHTESKWIDASDCSQESRSSAQRKPRSLLEGARVALSPAKVNGAHISTQSHSNWNQAQLATPKTPRHRDALGTRPSVLVTPRHKTLASPLTPRSTPNSASSVYSCARRLFVHSSEPGRLVGRDAERTQLSNFINDGIASKRGHCLYISGPPGTGKSALVAEVCKDVEKTENIKMSHINCMSIRGAHDVFEKLAADFCLQSSNTTNDASASLRKCFFPSGASSDMFVVTLDEIDHLITLDLEILYTLFEWALDSSSRLLLVGIANALDLTDRFLPRLKARNLRPTLLPMLPYTAHQINSVITSKLKSLLPLTTATPDYTPILHPTAAQFCSKKVASQTGDLRKAFDIVRRSIDLIELETKKRQQEEINLLSLQDTPSKPKLDENAMSLPSKSHRNVLESMAALTAENAPRATIAHLARITSSAFNHGSSQRLQTLNLQQKAALCSLLALEKKKHLKRDIFATPSKSANALPSIRQAFESYSALCKRDGALHPLKLTEFVDVIGSLETLSLVYRGDGKNVSGLVGRMTPSKKIMRVEDGKLSSAVSEKEFEGCIDGPSGTILRSLLRET